MSERRKAPNFSGYSEYHERELRQEYAKISENRIDRIRQLSEMGIPEHRLRVQFSLSHGVLRQILEES